MKRVVTILILILIPAFAISAKKPGKEKTASELTAELKTGTGVEKREIVGEADIFPSTVKRIYCWSLIKGAKQETTITHEWFYGDKKMASIKLKVGVRAWRTWSSKAIRPEWRGTWTIKVVDEKKNVIASKDIYFAPQDKVSKLIADLKDKNWHIRKKAVEALGEIKDPRAIKPLINVLKDEDWAVWEEATKVLGKIKDPRVVGLLIDVLKDENDAVRIRAIKVLNVINPKWMETEEVKRKVLKFITALKDKDSNVRAGAARALGEIKNPRAVRPLIFALKDKDVDVRIAAAEALGKIKDPSAVEPLILALNDKDWHVRVYVRSSLNEINPKWMETEEAKRKVPKFITALKDKDSNVREAAAEALGEIKDPSAVEPLILALKDKKWGVRMEAADALGEIKNPRAVSPLIVALKDKEESVRSTAARALGKIKDPRAVKPLIDLLKDEYWYARMYAARALGEIKDPHAIRPLIDLLEDDSCWEDSIEALTKITSNWMEMEKAKKKDPTLTAALIAALKNEREKVREGIVEILGKIKDPRAIGPLIDALNDGNVEVRIAATKALGKIKDPRVIEPLIDALRDGNLCVRWAAWRTLMEITSQDIGFSFTKWQQWWKKNKDRFLKQTEEKIIRVYN